MRLNKTYRAFFKVFTLTFLLFVLSLSKGQASLQLSTEQKLADFNFLVTELSSSYVAWKYKQDIHKVNWETLLKSYTHRVTESKSNKEFYYLLKEFLGEFDDMHINLSLPGDFYRVVVPGLSFDFIGNKVLLSRKPEPIKADLSWDDIYKLEDPENLSLLERGVELIAVDGVSVGEYLEQHLERYMTMSHPLARKKMAVWHLTHRTSSRYPSPQPSQVSTFTFLLPSGASLDLKAKWFFMGAPSEFFADSDSGGGQEGGAAKSSSGSDSDLLNSRISRIAVSNENTYLCTGYSRFDVPENHKPMKGLSLIQAMLNSQTSKREPLFGASKDKFVAYRYDTEILIDGQKETKSIGYLRIPHYLYNDDFDYSGQPLYELWKHLDSMIWDDRRGMSRNLYKDYRSLVAELDRETDALVIDQTYNCGGLVSVAKDMLSFFVSGDFQPLPMRYVASWQMYRLFKSIWEAKNMQLYQLMMQNKMDLELVGEVIFYKQVVESLKTSLSEGSYLSEALQHGTPISPNAVRYTKPIVLLMDSISGSAGDHFPYILRKNNPKVILVGETTQGGGTGMFGIHDEKYLPHSGLSYKLPNIAFMKRDGRDLENNGVRPDYIYRVTKEDFTGAQRYANYRRYYESLIGQQLSTASRSEDGEGKNEPESELEPEPEKVVAP